jgi:hypothetical protein
MLYHTIIKNIQENIHVLYLTTAFKVKFTEIVKQSVFTMPETYMILCPKYCLLKSYIPQKL